MKRLLFPALTFAVAATLTFCSPSADEQKNDSLAQDSTKKEMKDDADSILKAMGMTSDADSLKKDSAK